jgi:transposase
MLYTLLELPNSKTIGDCHLSHLTSVLSKYSKGKYGKDKALHLRDIARSSIGSSSPALAFEMQQVIRTIIFLQNEIDLIDKKIKEQVIEINTPLLSIPGIAYISAAMILAEIGDINSFGSPSKLLAFAGLEPSTYQSGNFVSTHATMVKRGSKYLRWALMNSTRLVCMRDQTFFDYKAKKLSEGKHYFVALSHTCKKLVRVIYHLLKTNQTYQPQV